MKTEILNHQRRYRLTMPTAASLTRELALRALRHRGPWGHLLVVLTDDCGILAVNREVFGHDYATDVISCSFEPLPGERPEPSGELYVNVQRAAERCGLPPRSLGQTGSRRPWTCHHELMLYIAHGLDHLAGANDGNPVQRAAMRRRELRWVRELVKSRGGMPAILRPPLRRSGSVGNASPAGTRRSDTP